MDLENNGEMALLEKLANQIKGHGNGGDLGDFWSHSLPLRDKVEKPTFYDILCTRISTQNRHGTFRVEQSVKSTLFRSNDSQLKF